MIRSLPVLSLLLALAALALLPGRALAQSQTGSLVLELVDADSNPLPAVAITLEGERLQGLQLRETDANGRARFAFLPPGSYEAEFQAESFVTFRASFDVGLGETRVERVQMTKGTMTETQVVSGQAAIDVTDTGINYSFDEKTMQKLQIGSANRDYLDVLGRAGGVTAGGGNPNVHGATIGENRYLVDGVDTTDPVTGTFGQNLNFDTIEAVEFQTGGFRAEFGQATGGIVNVVTKSGGNDLEAIADLRYNDNGMIEGSELVLGNGNHAFDNHVPQKFRRIDLTLGGPLKKDKLWYQLGWSDIISNRQPPGGDGSRDFGGEDRLLKLTWQANENHKVAVQYTADPADIVNANAGTGVRADAHRTQVQGADFYSVNYWGQFPNNWNLNVRAGAYESELNSEPANDSGLPARVVQNNGYISRNYNDAQYSTRIRDQFGWDLEHHSSNARWHALKFGLEVQSNEFTSRRAQPGGAVEYVRAPGDDPATPENETAEALAADPYGETFTLARRDRLMAIGEQTNEGDVLSMYIQDTWYATDQITVDYGLRWDRTSMSDDTGEEVVAFSKFQPRLGIAWDVLGDKRHAISWSAARYMDPLILTVANAVNKNASTTFVDLNEIYYGDCNGDGVIENLVVENCAAYGGPSGSVVDPDLRPTYKDEVTLGYKFAVRSNVVFGARWYWSQTEDIIEDIESPVGSGNYRIVNLPELVRRYQGLELDVAWEGRRVHLFSNWTISSSKGNVEYTQHLGSDFDLYPDHYVNRYGFLADDQRHRIKLYGWVDLPKQFTISWDAAWSSGAPYNVVDTASPDYGAIFVEPRGSRRLPSTAKLDVEVRKAWTVGEKAELQLIGSVFNFFKENEVTAINGNIGDLGSITGYQAPRSYEVGFRFTWR